MEESATMAIMQGEGSATTSIRVRRGGGEQAGAGEAGGDRTAGREREMSEDDPNNIVY
jgi:hypothetical protein